jgi:hypothetical protein
MILPLFPVSGLRFAVSPPPLPRRLHPLKKASAFIAKETPFLRVFFLKKTLATPDDVRDFFSFIFGP